MPPGTEEVLAHLDPLTLTAQVVALLILAGVFVKALSWLAPLARGARSAVAKAHSVLDAFLGTPEERDEGGFITKPAQPGVMSRLEKIEYHIKANGGESAYDQHTKKLDANSTRLDQLARSVEDARLAADRDREADREANREMRKTVAEVAAMVGDLQRRYTRDLAANHPHYEATD